jgi:hypothetical protein
VIVNVRASVYLSETRNKSAGGRNPTIYKMDLTNTDIISIHENLESFAKHYQNKGALIAHELIRKEMIPDKDIVRNGDAGMYKFYQGYDNAVKDVLKLIRKNFIL